MLRSLLFALCVSTPAFAADVPAPDIEALFPHGFVAPARAAEFLTAERVGPPARTYDQTTETPSAAYAEEKAIEAVLFAGEHMAAPDSLRRYARLHLALSRIGHPDNRAEWFLAEHVGLATIPLTLGTFYTGDPTAAPLAKLIAPMIEHDDELRGAVVVLEHDDTQNLWVGEVTGLYGAAEFEPFPRVGTPGGVVVIPGTLLAGDSAYGLYVTQPGPEVSAFPLAGKGAFDVEVPLPAQPGVYRVAMNRMRKRQLPDSTFFFSLYVGAEPPTSFAAVQPPALEPSATVEEAFLAQVNVARAHYDLGPLAWADRRAELQALVTGLPPYQHKRARWRYVSQFVDKDPLPGVPHGTWGAGFADGQDAAEVAWTSLEHPISRMTFLAANAATLVAGAAPRADGGVSVLAFVLAAGADTAAGRDLVWRELDRRYGGGQGVQRAPSLQADLDALAADVAVGKVTMKVAMRDLGGELKAAGKAGTVSGAMGWTIVTAPAGQAPDLSAYTAPAGCKTFALGVANGDLGTKDGFDRTVFVLVAAGTAK